MNWRIRLTWWDKLLLAIMAVAAIVAFVRFATGIGTIANINNAYPWGWWVGYGIMTLIAIGGVGIPESIDIYSFLSGTILPLRYDYIFTAFNFIFQFDDSVVVFVNF